LAGGGGREREGEKEREREGEKEKGCGWRKVEMHDGRQTLDSNSSRKVSTVSQQVRKHEEPGLLYIMERERKPEGCVHGGGGRQRGKWINRRIEN
jgi:hypothetical protein